MRIFGLASWNAAYSLAPTNSQNFFSGENSQTREEILISDSHLQ